MSYDTTSQDITEQEMAEIIIYTDGSCLGNPGPGGWAFIILEGEKRTEGSGHDKDTTNNKMEMTAVIEALKHLHKKHKTDLQKLNIHFFIDSNLIVQTLTSNWKKKKNLELWAEIEKLSAWQNIKWDWIKAHHTSELNNAVDELANAEAHKAKKLG